MAIHGGEPDTSKNPEYRGLMDRASKQADRYQGRIDQQRKLLGELGEKQVVLIDGLREIRKAIAEEELVKYDQSGVAEIIDGICVRVLESVGALKDGNGDEG